MEATWIWSNDINGKYNHFVDFRRTFYADSQIRNGMIRLSANQEYRLFVNGTYVGMGPSPSDYRWQYADSYDITAYLHEGLNAIACVCYHIGICESTIAFERGPAGFWAELDVESENGRTSIVTDASWRVRQSPRWVQNTSRISRWGGFKEIYITGSEDEWREPAYDDSEWHFAEPTADAADGGAPLAQPIPREIPFLHRELLQPASLVRIDANKGMISGISTAADYRADRLSGTTIDASAPGSFPGLVFDFEREVVGYPYLRLTAPAGGAVDIRYGESLDVDHVDTILLKPGANDWTSFGRRAFRYMQLTFHACPEPVVLESCGIEHVRYPFEEIGQFRCSDPLLNRIWEVGKETVLLNSQEHLEDCPWREKALWVADELVMAKVIYPLFGDTALVRKSLLQGARIQNADGSIPATGPESNPSVMPDFCAYWLLAVCDYWKYTKDEPFIKTVWPNIVKVFEWFGRHEDEHGLYHHREHAAGYSFVDWAPHIDRRERVTAISCVHRKALLGLAEIAAELELDDCGNAWTAKAEELKRAIRLHCWDEEQRGFVDCVTDGGKSELASLQTNVLAVWCDVMTYAEFIRYKEHQESRNAIVPVKSPFFQCFVLEMLAQNGAGEDFTNTIRSYWGEMLNRGATTWWETFDPASPACTVPHRFQGNTPTYLRDDVPVSHCHGWGAAPTNMLTQTVLGVDVLEDAGNGKIRLRPHVFDLEWAEGTAVSSYGRIGVSWKRENPHSWTCHVTLPESVGLEVEWGDEALRRIPNKTVYVNGEPMAVVEG